MERRVLGCLLFYSISSVFLLGCAIFNGGPNSWIQTYCSPVQIHMHSGILYREPDLNRVWFDHTKFVLDDLSTFYTSIYKVRVRTTEEAVRGDKVYKIFDRDSTTQIPFKIVDDDLKRTLMELKIHQLIVYSKTSYYTPNKDTSIATFFIPDSYVDKFLEIMKNKPYFINGFKVEPPILTCN